MTATAQVHQPAPALPTSRGPVSEAVLVALRAGQFSRDRKSVV